MKKLLISGKSGSGKDTLAGFMKELLIANNKRPLIIHFADMVKEFAKLYYNWDGNKDEAGRTLLQHLGTDIVRKYDPNYWAEQVARFIAAENSVNDFDCAIIPDARFSNEIELTKKYNYDTYAIRIERYLNPKTPFLNAQLTPEQHLHPSETSLDNYEHFDYIINNYNNSLDTLREAAKSILIQLNLIGEIND